jgi:YesN/AraC family two-component response regulator
MSQQWSVVLADDTEDLRLLLGVVLRAEGTFEVVGEASNGSEAIDVVAEHTPSVVLLDLAMPVMDGLQAIPELRRCSPDTKIVVLSGFDDTAMAKESL